MSEFFWIVLWGLCLWICPGWTAAWLGLLFGSIALFRLLDWSYERKDAKARRKAAKAQPRIEPRL